MAFEYKKSWGGQKPPPGTPQDFSHPLANGLTGHWPLLERGGKIAFDVTGRANDAALSTAVWSAAGNHNGLVVGPGNTGVVVSSAAVSATAEFSASLWFRRNEIISTNDRPIMFKDAASNRCFLVTSLATSAMKFSVAANSGDAAGNFVVSPTGVIVRDKWYHIVAVFYGAGATNADRAKIYINAAKQVCTETGTIPSAATATSANLNFGIGGATNVMVDDVRYYSRALLDAEVARLYFTPFADMMPIRRSSPRTAAAGGGFQAAWARNANVVMQPGRA